MYPTCAYEVLYLKHQSGQCKESRHYGTQLSQVSIIYGHKSINVKAAVKLTQRHSTVH